MTAPVAILSAMDQEIRMVEDRLDRPETHELCGRSYTTGRLPGVDVVTAISGYGKVAAAATTACVIQEFEVAAVIFGGVAGGIRPGVSIGDIVVADHLIQHDFDASPIFERYVIPSLGLAEIPTDPELTAQIISAAELYVSTRSADEIGDIPGRVDASAIKIHRGLITSGDRFISNLAEAATLQGELPEVLAVEMEGAAVAQVCAERKTPFAVFRLISDRSDHDAATDFIAFVSTVAAPLTAGIAEEWANALSE